MTCARLASMFSAAAVATLFQAGPIGAQPMTGTSISTAIIPVEHVVVRTKKPYIEVKSCPGNPAWPTGQPHPLIATRKQSRRA
jgi:hypothetical protein